MELLKILKALGDELRIRILNLIKDDALCVCELNAILGTSQSNVSRHLIKLSNANLVTYQKKAQWVYYQLNKELLANYPFLSELLDQELAKLKLCREDTEKLKRYRATGATCDQLRECKVNLDFLFPNIKEGQKIE